MPLERHPPPLIMVAPTGARRGKGDHPRLPLSIQEIRDETVACASAGADALHLHVRDQWGGHSIDPGRYKEAIDEVHRALPDFPIQITTESAGVFDVEQQLACLRDLRPKAASISIREVARDAEMASRIYGICSDNGSSVQHILYDLDDWTQLLTWREQGTVKEGQADVIFVLGRYTPPKPAELSDLSSFTHLFQQLPGRVMICAFGPSEHDVLCAASAHGADLRVGFENNIHAEDGELAESNATNVAALKAALVFRTQGLLQ
ncbi:MAG: 3-keto-5-aminohexanoate cleavage protein [Tateyamaria sp.]|uniref:3-keto-5-aminohexanoate cleavage protein n=1 Tax=Tateyamaria sp. TaxID=1929288 RepID=UPI0032818658